MPLPCWQVPNLTSAVLPLILQDDHLLRREVVFDWLWFRRRPDGQMGHHPATVLDRDLLVVLEDDPVLIPTAWNFPSRQVRGRGCVR
jgi:hypothetical protein